MRNSSLVRVLCLIESLKHKRATLQSLADEFNVSTRTIRRDLEALSLAGVPVRTTADAYANGINGFWWIER